MSVYISPDNEYPRHVGDIKLANPSWQEGDELPIGWMQVIETEPPIRTDGHILYELPPVLDNGVYYQNWATRKLTDKEILEQKRALVRHKVRMHLSLTDEEASLLTDTGADNT